MTVINLDTLQVNFYPPLYKRPRRGQRDVTLIDERGMILGGIVVYYHAGASGPIEVPEALTILNRPEQGEAVLSLSDLNREVLRSFIRDKLRVRPNPSYPSEQHRPGHSVGLLRKARAARSGRRN